jgi:2-polyprenyl-3-methyl-5-hydroxy-6-metoxy-1,4-benzoquinol methylase
MGLFLSKARQRGLEVTGIELSEAASKKARQEYGFVFQHEKMEDFNPHRQFDIVHLNHVLEHLADPHRAVKVICEFLEPGGVVYIEVPMQLNVYDRVKYRILKRGWKFDCINSIHHPVFYSPRTLRQLFS